MRRVVESCEGGEEDQVLEHEQSAAANFWLFALHEPGSRKLFVNDEISIAPTYMPLLAQPNRMTSPRPPLLLKHLTLPLSLNRRIHPQLHNRNLPQLAPLVPPLENRDVACFVVGEDEVIVALTSRGGVEGEDLNRVGFATAVPRLKPTQRLISHSFLLLLLFPDAHIPLLINFKHAHPPFLRPSLSTRGDVQPQTIVRESESVATVEMPGWVERRGNDGVAGRVGEVGCGGVGGVDVEVGGCEAEA